MTHGRHGKAIPTDIQLSGARTVQFIHTRAALFLGRSFPVQSQSTAAGDRRGNAAPAEPLSVAAPPARPGPGCYGRDRYRPCFVLFRAASASRRQIGRTRVLLTAIVVDGPIWGSGGATKPGG